MRVLYYSHPSFLDLALPFAHAMSQLVETHLLVELSPEQWTSSLFDLPRLPLPSGIVSAEPVLAGRFPTSVQKYWRDLTSFNFVVHNCPRSIHPASWWVSHTAVRFARRIEPSVVHLDDVSLRLAWALPELGRLPVVLSLHDPEPHGGSGGWRLDLARWLTFGRARTYVLHNRTQIEPFCRRYRVPKRRVASYPLGIYEIYRAWGSSNGRDFSGDAKTILFFGRLAPYKGLDVLYRALPRVAASVTGLRVVVAGKVVPGYTPPPPPSLPNGATVELKSDYISNADLAELFQHATAVVCPYTDATQSGVVLTAYGFGKPVVATEVGGLPEYVRNGTSGILVPSRDSDALARALVDVVSDGALRSRLTDGINHLAEGPLSWSAIAQQALAIYEGVA
jgi:glycosyltransferase involved in cell wall biosynthesis